MLLILRQRAPEKNIKIVVNRIDCTNYLITHVLMAWKDFADVACLFQMLICYANYFIVNMSVPR